MKTKAKYPEGSIVRHKKYKYIAKILERHSSEVVLHLLTEPPLQFLASDHYFTHGWENQNGLYIVSYSPNSINVIFEDAPKAARVLYG